MKLPKGQRRRPSRSSVRTEISKSILLLLAYDYCDEDEAYEKIMRHEEMEADRMKWKED